MVQQKWEFLSLLFYILAFRETVIFQSPTFFCAFLIQNNPECSGRNQLYLLTWSVVTVRLQGTSGQPKSKVKWNKIKSLQEVLFHQCLIKKISLGKMNLFVILCLLLSINLCADAYFDYVPKSTCLSHNHCKSQKCELNENRFCGWLSKWNNLLISIQIIFTSVFT